MKVIDLLNKAANKEEVPKKIKVLFNIFEYDEDNYNYKNVDKTQENLLRHLGHYKGIALNDEVEIIEDTPKEDKKLDLYNTQYSLIPKWFRDEEMIRVINENFEKHKQALKRIVDYINNMENKR